MTPAQNKLDLAADYICPDCRGDLSSDETGYQCLSCNKFYPILCGIPDFRLTSDRYLNLSDERDKAQYLHDYGIEHTFNEMVHEYYRITDDVSQTMARKFTAYVLNGEARGDVILDSLPSPIGICLDIGCASAGTILSAKRRGHSIVGIDIALRWLVIGAKRLNDAGLCSDLICADITALPFRPNMFDTIIAADLIEHVDDPDRAISSIRAQLAPRGTVYLSAANRYTLLPYSLAGMWGVGFLPEKLRRQYVKARQGIDTLRNATLMSPYKLSRLIKSEGLTVITQAPLRLPPITHPTTMMRSALLTIYRVLRKIPILKELILYVGPVFEIVAQKTTEN